MNQCQITNYITYLAVFCEVLVENILRYKGNILYMASQFIEQNRLFTNQSFADILAA